MRKFKIALVALLAVVLAVLCVTGSTFSWFSRPKSLTGKQLDLPASANSSVTDGLSFETYASSDGVTYDTTTVTNLSETAGLDSGARKYYRTDIYNSGADAQSVSLYLQSLTLNSNGDAFALGVNDPTKTYKTFKAGASVQENYVNRRNIYVGIVGNQASDITGKFDHINSWNNDNLVYHGSSIVSTTGTAEYNVSQNGFYNGKTTFNMYSVTIDSRATNFQMKFKNGVSGSGDQGHFSGFDRSNGNTMVMYQHSGTYYSEQKQSGEEAQILQYYSNASLTVGESVSLKAEAYGKNGVTYKSSDSSVATVDSSTGMVKALKAGTATITVTAKGVYNDTLSAECQVTVSSVLTDYNDLPIVTNVAVLPSEVDSDGVIYPSVSVYWYIKNDSGNNGLKYTIPELYLTL